MPNWCDNSLYITTTKKYAKQLIKAAEEDRFLSFIKPLDKDTTDAQIGGWGTKWEVNAYLNEQKESPDNPREVDLNFTFDSAWAPPIAAYDHLLMHPEVSYVSAYYFEPGMDFAGLWEDGIDDEITDLGKIYANKKHEYTPLELAIEQEFDLEQQYVELYAN